MHGEILVQYGDTETSGDFFTSEILLRRIVSNNRRSSVSLPVREKRTIFRNSVFEILLPPSGMENYSDTRVFTKRPNESEKRIVKHLLLFARNNNTGSTS